MAVTTTLPPKAETGKRGKSTRNLLTDARFAAIIADELGVKVSTARTAFIGEPKRRASEISGWALEKGADAEERARMILAWAKKHRAGAFREEGDADFSRRLRAGVL